MTGNAAPIDADLIVIGAGVVGLATAMHAALQGLSVLVLERNAGFGQETSARNSEVIHAGIYYPQGSLKAQTCVEGSARLYAFAQEHGVPVKRCGKLIVATQPDELDRLTQIERKATAAGARDLQLIDGPRLHAMEPELNAVGAILSPHTGIVDSHALMLAMLGVAENHGAQLVTHTAVEALHHDGDAWSVRTPDTTVRARGVVNAAGLWAHDIAVKTEGLPQTAIPPLHYARGCYFGYSGAVPFRHLIYPVPVAGGLGTHLTLDLAGQARFGPDVTWVEQPDYSVPDEAREGFAAAVARFWQGVDPNRLTPDYAGVRPKLSGPGEPAHDFLLSAPEAHGLPGLVNLFGIESPGLTASLPLGERAVAATGLLA